MKRSRAEEDELENIQPPKDVVAFNELRSCADLFRMYKEGILEIQPDFQRSVVWEKVAQSTFIDSLMKQLPIPSMCFSLDFNTQKWQVVDGLQRMTAIINFLDDKEWRLSRSTEISPVISGRSNIQIKNDDEESKILFRKVENLTLPITVIRCNRSSKDHSEYLFTIFKRLNSGGERLNHQEIRNCIYSGKYNTNLKLFDTTNSDWKFIKNLLPGKGARFRSVEALLRYFALNANEQGYTGNMPNFLNEFMRANRDIDTCNELKTLEPTLKIFISAINALHLEKLTYTLLEAALIGIAKNRERAGSLNTVMLGRKLEQLIDSHEISSETSKSDTTAKQRVIERIHRSVHIFSS